MRRRLIFSGGLIIITVLYVGGCRRAGKWLVKEETLSHADAMVLLMGNFPGRVLQAADLFRDGKAERLIIVEESMGAYRGLEERGVSIISQTTQARDAATALGIPGDSITVLPGDARSTLTEALVVREHLARNTNIDTLIVVSSPFHMRRASLIFREALGDLPHPVFIGCSPSSYSDFNADRWWRQKEDIQDVLAEYLKILSFELFEKQNLKAAALQENQNI